MYNISSIISIVLLYHKHNLQYTMNLFCFFEGDKKCHCLSVNLVVTTLIMWFIIGFVKMMKLFLLALCLVFVVQLHCVCGTCELCTSVRLFLRKLG